MKTRTCDCTNVACGCTTETCGCCAGTQKLTPASTENRPGLDALSYRVGTHGSFLETMKASLASTVIQATGADGQTMETFRPLRGLTTRDASDPAIALLDGWATVGDVLTFYQERIANEGYVRTATERRSVLELARLVGYALRPGVAATVYLAYTLDNSQTVPVDIPAGARSQSIPGPGELPQSFETSDDLVAHTEWNDLQVRLTQPQNITFDNALTIDHVYVAGVTTNLKAGDSILLVFGDNGDPSILRKVARVENQAADNRTRIDFSPVQLTVDNLTFTAEAMSAVLPLLAKLVQDLKALVAATNNSAAERAEVAAQEILTNCYLGFLSAPPLWAVFIRKRADSSDPTLVQRLKTFQVDILRILKDLPNPPGQGIAVTDPSKFVTSLLQPAVPQAASSSELSRSLNAAFGAKSDLNAQLLVNFVPQIKETFYTAWSSANVNKAVTPLKAIYAFRTEASLFGATVPMMATYNNNNQLNTPDQWTEWTLDTSEAANAAFLDQVYEGIAPGSLAMIQVQTSSDVRRIVKQVSAAQTVQRTAYAISGKTTQVQFPDDWWKGNRDTMSTLRGTLILAQTEELTLVETPITSNVKGQEIPLDGVYKELASGRWVIFSGERADINAVNGVQAAELLMISGLRQDFDSKLPGDKTHTTLLLATPTAYTYKRDTLTIYGNVVKATHGETRNETLGSGDGSQALQSFTLKQPPLTFVAAPTPAGAESTLKVYVNSVEWHETDTFAGLGPKDRNFITETDNDSKTTTIFGNGEQGARLPTGVENVHAVYRNGIGQPGNVSAQQISLLQTRPLGVKSVINPLPASGGADREGLDQARENAPLAVMSLDRLVSIQDYADFTRTFAGIGKAASRRLSDGRRELVHITIAGADDIPIDPVSDLYRNLLLALRQFGDPDLPVQVDLRELLILVLSAKVRLNPDYFWDPVALNIRTAILDTFGFQKRSLGQPALLCEIISLIQNIEGVEYVDVDAFGGIPEKKANPDGTRRLLTLEETAQTVVAITSVRVQSRPIIAPPPPPASWPAQRVDANLADFENGAIRPAQLAIFTPSVSDTIVLNQIL